MPAEARVEAGAAETNPQQRAALLPVDDSNDARSLVVMKFEKGEIHLQY